MAATDRTPDPLLGAAFEDAFRYALERHRTQSRKGTTTPYMSHLLQVCGRVLEAGGTQDEAIAALLHDAVEDAPQDEVAAVKTAIAQRFGSDVLEIVMALTDAEGEPKPPWRERKEQYLAHLRTETRRSVLLVSLADKAHNAGAIVRDVTTHGESVWGRFNAGRRDLAWYYDSLAGMYPAELAPGLLRELREAAAQLRRLAGAA